MATKEQKKSDLEELSRNFSLILEQSQKIMEEFMRGAENDGAVPVAGQAAAANAFMEMLKHLAAHPEKIVEAQLELWRDWLRLLSYLNARMIGKEALAPSFDGHTRDKRFHDMAWEENITFNFIKQSYFLVSEWTKKLVHNVEGMDAETAQKVDFYTRQLLDAISPTNFLATNPEVLRETLASNGENLVKGLSHMLDDLKRGKGHLSISQTSEKAFEVGKNLAITKGEVVFRNDLIELIQYYPYGESVHKTPVLIVPAWINKYYILDMKPDNSLVRWLVEQGYTVFMISWVNPDKRLAAKSFEDYMGDGLLSAIGAVEKATDEKQVNLISYCLGGTLTAATAAYLKAKGEDAKIKSITYLTTLVDFSKPGDLGVFIDKSQINGIEEFVNKNGFFPGRDMAMIFSMLRARDLVWSFVINNYLMGREPFPFDLLYWNSDSTRLPACMHIFYLRNMYLENLLVKPGALKLNNVPIDISKITTPSYILSTREDHIAPWKSTYKATQLYKGKVRFVLSASGHVAGVVNPPSRNKYGHWVNDENPANADDWLKGAKEVHSSWWGDWDKWMNENDFTGAKIPARIPGEGKLKPICPAPGTYVKMKD